MFYGNNELPSFDNLIDMKTIFACLIFIINVAVYAQLENCESARIEYLNKNPDVKKAGIDPWTHYKYYGKNEGRVWPNCNQKSADLTTSLIPNNIPSNGLIAWWPFNGNANDESGNGNNGTVNGATLITDRNGQQAYKFDGIDDIIKINSKIDNLGINDFSVSMWILKNDTPISETLSDKLENINTSQTGSLVELIENQGFTFNQPIDLSVDENRYSLYLKDIKDDFPALKSHNIIVRPNQIIYPNADLMVIPNRQTCRAVIKKLDYCRKSSTGFDCQKDLLKNKIIVLRCGDLKMIGGVLGLKDEYQGILRSGAPYGVADLKRVLGKAQYGSNSSKPSGIEADDPNAPNESLVPAWSHCVIVKLKNEVSLYLNGVKQQQNVTSNTSHINITTDLSFGARYFENQTNEYFKGSIDDIGIWNRALTDDEIQGLFLSKQLNEIKLSQEQYYKMVYEGESDNPYSSFEDYLASQKKENQSEVKTNSSNLNSDYANRIIVMNNKLEAINDTIQKIAYLNLVNSQLNPNKSLWTPADSSIYDNLHLRKLLYIFPNKHNDPKITKADWKDLYDFLKNRCNENSFAGSELRPWFLYWNCMVRQYMGTEYFEIKWEQKILEEYTESNFPLGSPFYKECQRIVNGSNTTLPPPKPTNIVAPKTIDWNGSYGNWNPPSIKLVVKGNNITVKWTMENNSIATDNATYVGPSKIGQIGKGNKYECSNGDYYLISIHESWGDKYAYIEAYNELGRLYWKENLSDSWFK
jgi:hypothetical protein